MFVNKSFSRRVRFLFLWANVAWLVLGSPRIAGAELSWRWSNPRPHGNNVVDMAYSSDFGLAVQVAERGQLYSSSDFLHWTPRTSGTDRALRGVAFMGGTLLVTGESGTVLYADSLDNIQPGLLSDTSTEDWLEGVAATVDLAVAVGDFGAIYTSEDGRQWERQGSPTQAWLRGVAAGVDGFVAVGEEGTILSSTDGTNWVSRVSNTAEPLNRVTHAEGVYLVVGDAGTFLFSLDKGTTWQSQASGAVADLYAVAGEATDRLLVGDREVWLHRLGSWYDQYEHALPPPLWIYYAAIGFPGYYFIAGQTGLMAEGSVGAGDHFDWTPIDESARTWLFDLVSLQGLHVAVGDYATVMTSAAGVDWATEIVPEAFVDSVFLGVGGDTNLLVGVGSEGSLMISPNLLTNIVVTNQGNVVTQEVSTLGVVWQDPGVRQTAQDLQGVCHGNGLYLVSGGGGVILTSPDGTNWTQRTTPVNTLLSGVAALPGRFVAVGDNGTILTSATGELWDQSATGLTNWLYRVRAVNNEFVAVGQGGAILRSGDGLAWSSEVSGTSEWLTDVTWLDDRYFASGTFGTLLSSTNGVDWSAESLITYKSLFGIGTDGSNLLAVGVEGVILRANVVPDLTPIQILDYSYLVDPMAGEAQNLFLFGGHPYQRFTLERRFALDDDPWLAGPDFEITGNSGTLYYLETFPLTNAPAAQLFQATLTE